MLTLAEKNAWLTALRSGEFRQGTSRLKSLDGSGKSYHCCLGVLCEVLGTKEERLGSYAYFKDSETGQIYSQGLPPNISERSGLSGFGLFSSSPAIVAQSNTATRIRKSLAGMNDGGMSFSEIADFLEVNLLTEG